MGSRLRTAVVLVLLAHVASAQSSCPLRFARLAVSNVFKNKAYGTVTVWHPGASEGMRYLDVIALPAGRRLPDRFLLGDGGFTRAIVAVDQTPGSELDKILAGYVARIRRETGGDREAIFTFLQNRLQDLVDGRWGLGVSALGDNRWDPKWTGPSEATWVKFRAWDEIDPSHEPELVDETMPIVELERFLTEPCSAYCLQKALLGRLLLDRLGIPSRFVLGATLTFEKDVKAYGHSWLEIPGAAADGTDLVLDVTHHTRGPKGKAHESDPTWFFYQGSYRFSDKRWPIVVPTNF